MIDYSIGESGDETVNFQDISTLLQEKLASLQIVDKTVEIVYGEKFFYLVWQGEGSKPNLQEKIEGETALSLKASEADWASLLTGELSPQMAFMAGKLQLTGDYGLALQLAQALV